MKFIKQIPFVMLLIVLTLSYILCGYIIGYHQGYRTGQRDYVGYLNRILENGVATKPDSDSH